MGFLNGCGLTSSSFKGTAKFHLVVVLPITISNALAIREVEVVMKLLVVLEPFKTLFFVSAHRLHRKGRVF